MDSTYLHKIKVVSIQLFFIHSTREVAQIFVWGELLNSMKMSAAEKHMSISNILLIYPDF